MAGARARGTASRLASAWRRWRRAKRSPCEGARGSGRTTLVQRLAWTLGVEGGAVVQHRGAAGGMSPREAVELELEAHASGKGSPTRRSSRSSSWWTTGGAGRGARSSSCRGRRRRGRKLVVVGGENDVRPMAKGRTRAFVVPPLDARSAEELVHRAVPSLPDAIRQHLVARVQGRPGTLRAFLKKARGTGDRVDGRRGRGLRASSSSGERRAVVEEPRARSSAAIDARARSRAVRRSDAPDRALGVAEGRRREGAPGGRRPRESCSRAPRRSARRSCSTR